MICRRLDSNGDYSFGYGKSNFIDNKEAIAQTIRTKLLLFQEEWWANLKDGLPLLQKIIGKYDLNEVREVASRLIEQRILEVEGVTEVLEIASNIDYSERSLHFVYSVNTIYGNINDEVIY